MVVNNSFVPKATTKVSGSIKVFSSCFSNKHRDPSKHPAAPVSLASQAGKPKSSKSCELAMVSTGIAEIINLDGTG